MQVEKYNVDLIYLLMIYSQLKTKKAISYRNSLLKIFFSDLEFRQLHVRVREIILPQLLDEH